MPKHIFLTPFRGTCNNWRLDLKVFADPSWVLVFKNGLKKCSSLTNDWVIDVWSCKKNVTEKKKGRRRRRRGPARIWGSDINKKHLYWNFDLNKMYFNINLILQVISCVTLGLNAISCGKLKESNFLVWDQFFFPLISFTSQRNGNGKTYSQKFNSPLFYCPHYINYLIV